MQAVEIGQAPPYGAYAPTPVQRWVMKVASVMPDNWICRQIASACRDIGVNGLTHPLDAEVFGQRVRLSPFNNVAARRLLFTPQYFDAAERRLLAAHALSRTGEYVFLDIGANVGGYSLFVAGLLGARARVLAFEPQPDVLIDLRYNIEQNPAARIEVFPVALSERDGEAALFIATRNKGESSLLDHSENKNQERGQTVRVPTRTLLSVLKEQDITRVDAMKIDIEGAEDLVLAPFLEGADDALLPAFVVIEDSRALWRRDLFALLQARGYAITARLRQNYILERP